MDITRTGQEETVNGVRIVFQITPGTEAPAEMNFHFPAHRALCMAENATHKLFGAGTDVAFASHHWPTWGTENVTRYLSQQRDLYAYLHDQTLRMLNNGATGLEIAEDIQLPPALETAWHARGYYGSVSHNVKATDLKSTVRLALSNGALIQTVNPQAGAHADLTLTLSKDQLLGLLAGHGLDGIEHTGDPAALATLMALLDTPDAAFPIVTR